MPSRESAAARLSIHSAIMAWSIAPGYSRLMGQKFSSHLRWGETKLPEMNFQMTFDDSRRSIGHFYSEDLVASGCGHHQMMDVTIQVVLERHPWSY
jgi:hypothetical protein